MKKHAFLYISAIFTVMISLLLSSCTFWMKESFNTKDAFFDRETSVSGWDTTNSDVDGGEFDDTSDDSDTEKTSDGESFESGVEDVSGNADTETSYDTNKYDEVVIEENIFGNYTPPEPETEEETTALSGMGGAISYTPNVPSGNGRAPLALMYHLILDEPYSSLESLFVRPSELESQIRALVEKGYNFVFADEYSYSDERTVIMSFDDGYIDNYTEMFPIIKKYNVKVTVFMITSYIGGADYLSRDMIKEMSESGLVSFQSHTHTHTVVTGADETKLRYEFSTSKNILEDITGREVKALCYPTGKYNSHAMSVASEYFDFAYTTESSLSTAGYDAMSLPRYRVSRGISGEYFKGILP